MAVTLPAPIFRTDPKIFNAPWGWLSSWFFTFTQEMKDRVWGPPQSRLHKNLRY
jgi:hypothetical protein